MTAPKKTKMPKNVYLATIKSVSKLLTLFCKSLGLYYILCLIALKPIKVQSSSPPWYHKKVKLSLPQKNQNYLLEKICYTLQK